MIKVTLEQLISNAIVIAGVSSLITYLFTKYKSFKGIIENITDFYGMDHDEPENKAGDKNFRENIYKKEGQTHEQV
ncbi:hypothetical protein [Companilactobacillus ginsenosidimutans]|uniref:Uncharacterized protein n=2 Tax=Companilactobacillus TaxID=2767879 RepID=A0A0H4R3H3_9LACO|nr:hypothetical protein [Companilactobacillus ginsenosidimutans]AKP66117.1 hypothetical protein ABM34_00125 [Companilactobacillus ginsenosidimutans]AKP68325.1 hypothetical protein ABM34_12760 [Companilactobacillus ginsenosidimutans]